MPLDAIENLPIYQEILIVLAKDIWREKNPNKFRLLQNFDKHFHLYFEKVTEGSAIAHLPRYNEDYPPLLSDVTDNDLFEEAQSRFDKLLEAANENREISNPPVHLRCRISKLGRSIREVEKLEFYTRKNVLGQSEAGFLRKKTKSNLLRVTTPNDIEFIEGFGIVAVLDDTTNKVKIISEHGEFHYTMPWTNLREELGDMLGVVVEFSIDVVKDSTSKIKTVAEQRRLVPVQPLEEALMLLSRLAELEGLDDGWLDALLPTGMEAALNTVIVKD